MPLSHTVKAEVEVAVVTAKFGFANTALSIAGTIRLGTVADPRVGLNIQVETVLAVPLIDLWRDVGSQLLFGD